MLRDQILTSLYQKRKTFAEFNWDTLFAPSMYCFMSEIEIGKLYDIATSLKYAGDIRKKDLGIRSVLEPLGFRRLASGTNRVVYSYLEDKNFLIKIAVDKTGMKNTPDEFRNQMFLRPFVTKCFESHPTGIIGSFERAHPITNIEEFVSIWDDVFEATLNIIGEYIIEDIGSNFFMNWALRDGFGPVLCDFPEVFKLDGNKLFCNRPAIPGQKFPLCGGTIDYDEGFNYLVCTHCGKQYTARELSKGIENKLIIMKGDIDMDVQLVRGSNVIVDGRDYGTATIRKPKIQYQGSIDAEIGRPSQMRPNTETMQATNAILQNMQAQAEQFNNFHHPLSVEPPVKEIEMPVDQAIESKEEGLLPTKIEEEKVELYSQTPNRLDNVETEPIVHHDPEAVEAIERPIEDANAVDTNIAFQDDSFDDYEDDGEYEDQQEPEQNSNRVKPMPPSGGVLDLY